MEKSAKTAKIKLIQNPHAHEIALFPPPTACKLPLNYSTSTSPIELTNYDAHRDGIRVEKIIEIILYIHKWKVDSK